MVHQPDFPAEFLQDDLALAYSLWEARLILSEDLIAVAEQALLAGTDSSAVAQLAGLSQTQATAEAPFLLRKALTELGLEPFDEHDGRLRLAQFHARRLLGGEITPYDGARYIWRAFLPEYPNVASTFLGLEDEYEGGWGRPHEQIDQDVIRAAHELLSVNTW